MRKVAAQVAGILVLAFAVIAWAPPTAPMGGEPRGSLGPELPETFEGYGGDTSWVFDMRDHPYPVTLKSGCAAHAVLWVPGEDEVESMETPSGIAIPGAGTVSAVVEEAAGAYFWTVDAADGCAWVVSMDGM